MGAMRFALLLALAFAAIAAHAEPSVGKLHVSAQVVISCRLEASVPRVGTAQRAGGAAAIGVTCTRGAMAAAVSCPATCEPVKAERTLPFQVAESRGEGPAVAILLF